MLVEFTQGMALGFAAAIPLGPINLLIMNEAINSFKNGFCIGLGAMMADMTYLLLILFGLSTYLQNAWLLNSLSIFGSAFLLYIAYSIFKNRHNEIKKIEIDRENSALKHFTKGYFLTLVNPYTSIFWLSIATLSLNASSAIANVAGLLFAIFLWITIMPFFVHKSRELISTKVSYVISLSSIIIFILFALIMLVKLFLNNSI